MLRIMFNSNAATISNGSIIVRVLTVIMNILAFRGVEGWGFRV